MFTNTLKKIFSKIIMATMMLTTFAAPMTNSVHAQNGTLTVGFNDINGGFELFNANQQSLGTYTSVNCSNAGGSYFECEISLPTGFYTVTFADINTDWQTPAPAYIQLNELGGEVQGTYLPTVGQNGVLGVAVNHMDASFTVTNVNQVPIFENTAGNCGNPNNNGYFVCQASLPEGFYTVTFDPLTDFDTPDPVYIQLSSTGGTVWGNYTPEGPDNGTLVVAVNHIDGGYDLFDVSNDLVLHQEASDCGVAAPNGYHMCEQSIPSGFYTVVFDNDVTNYTAPADIYVQLPDSGAAVWGGYVSTAPIATILDVAVNNQDASYTIYDVNQAAITTQDVANCGNPQAGYFHCEQSLPTGFYTVEFADVPGFTTPSDIYLQLPDAGLTVWGFYSPAVDPTGVVEVEVLNQNNVVIAAPTGDWQLQKCSTASQTSCFDIMAEGGAGDTYSNLDYSFYRIVFPNPVIPAGYAGRTVLPSITQELDATNSFVKFTIKYTESGYTPDVAYINVETTPVQGQVVMEAISANVVGQQATTTVEGQPSVYELDQADRFTIPTGSGGVTEPSTYNLRCLPAPGAFEAPVNPIQVNSQVYAMNTETLAGQCIYTPTNETVNVTIDTFGTFLFPTNDVPDTEITVDGVIVRAEGVSGAVPVTLTTTEDHTISFADRSGFMTPVNILVPAGTLDSSMTPAELAYLGYYVENTNFAFAEVNTENQNGNVYLEIGPDDTQWLVGHANTDLNDPLVVHFNETLAHEFRFQDRNPPANPAFYLRAVPTTATGFSVNKAVTLVGTDVTHYQENYVYDGSGSFLTGVPLVGDYIAEADAAFFRARTTNADPVFGEIYLDINGEATQTEVPGAATFTEVFISDVVNDTDTTSFQSPITVGTESYVATPGNYDLSTFTPSATVNDLESTYVSGTVDVLVQLVSLDPNISPTAGLTVAMDGSTNALTVDNAGSIEAGFTGVDATQAHTIVCPTIAGLQAPNAIYLAANTLQPGVNTYTCLYAPLATSAEIQIETEAVNNVNLEADIILNVDGQDYNIGSTQNDADPLTPATLELYVDSARANVIDYSDITPYITPADDVVNVIAGTTYQSSPANIFNGLYTLQSGDVATLNFFLYELDPNNGPVPDRDVNLNGTVQQSDAAGETTFTGVPVDAPINVSFEDHISFPAYVTPLDLNLAANQLVGGQSYDFIVYYVPSNFAVTLDIETLDENNLSTNVNGAISLITNGSQPILLGFGTAQAIVSNDPLFSYEVDWGPTSPASNYIEPLLDPQAVDVTGVSAGGSLDVDGLYRLCVTGNCEVVNITAWDETGTSVLNSVSITVNGQNVGNGQHSGTYDVGANLDIQFEDVPTHDTPRLFVNGVSNSTSHTITYTVATGQNDVEAFYDINGNSVGFNVGTRDNQGNALTEDIVHGITGTETAEATPAFFAVADTDLSAYTINFADRPGYITPDSVVIVNQAIASLPANVLITNNGVPYVPGTQLVLTDTYDIVATYEPFFILEKTIVSEQTITNNNKRVDYQIVITRNSQTAPGPMSLSLHDVLSDNARVISGTNGGTMTTVPNNGNHSECSNNCGDVTAADVVVAIDNPGNSVTITYQLLSNNSGIPANQSSDFVNTVTGTFDDNGNQVVITTGATVSVIAAPTTPTNPPTGGGGGGGGGVILIRGDMILEVEKEVSLDNVNFVDASDPDSPLMVPERINSTLFTRVKITNKGQVSAINIKYLEGFDQAGSLITSDEIMNVQGDDGVEFNDTTNVITIDSISVGGEANFTYEQNIQENGANGELAEEFLQLEGFSTRLRRSQDGLTKHGIGDHYPSWLQAGEGTTVRSGDLLELSISTDKAAARVGEEVTYTVKATNLADFDFTGLTITYNYDETALEILNPFGGRDTGSEIHWNRGILRPGESVEYQVRTRVSDTAPVGGSVRTTARGLVNEIENPSVVDHYLTIIGGITPQVPHLAQTGVGHMLLLLLGSALAYLGYGQVGRRRYAMLKQAALRPL